jgi:dTDP-4-dehydrorhamnose reductase
MSKKKKILLFGSAGMAGHVMLDVLRQDDGYEVINVSRSDADTEKSVSLDITNRDKLEELILSVAPDFIINCIGVLIKGANNNNANAIYVNAFFPHELKRLADKVDAKLIHISTDCVFSGAKGNYTESDYRDGKDVYAQTKILGEIIDNKHVTIRTSIIGPELKSQGEGLFHWFMLQKGEINGFTNAFWSGVTTYELSKAVKYILKEGQTGLIQLTSKEKISKYDLLQLFKKIWNKKEVSILPVASKEVDKSLINTREDFAYLVPAYEDMLQDQLRLMQENKNLYRHYSF